ncbi:hypothetical protein [Brevibacterium permense]|uniref:hypothetical protein n=1 Tax=Brevibacterium permense TaxID=234834 RepID=UPI0021D1EEE2|nr:hypothetical protein [Brevibacterium permense]
MVPSSNLHICVNVNAGAGRKSMAACGEHDDENEDQEGKVDPWQSPGSEARQEHTTEHSSCRDPDVPPGDHDRLGGVDGVSGSVGKSRLWQGPARTAEREAPDRRTHVDKSRDAVGEAEGGHPDAHECNIHQHEGA